MAPLSLQVATPQGHYPVWVGEQLLGEHALFQDYIQKQVFIVSDNQVAKHYLAPLQKACQLAGANLLDYDCIAQGEQHKTLLSVERLWSRLIKSGYHRDMTLIALGGGMVGDVAGFCAACYLRGVNLIQCPTTLLAQIDAAIGSKTAINHQGKNLIGAFHSPQAVVVDLATLATLSQREFVSGLAELIKYGAILDLAFLDWLEANIARLLLRDPVFLKQAVCKAISLKARVVAADLKEKSSRACLNFGHTVAHAIESLLGYQGCLHGEAVAIGMGIASHLSVQQGTLLPEERARLMDLLARAQLPIQLPKKVSCGAILDKIKQDKKHAQARLHWVLLSGLGKAYLCDGIQSPQVMSALKAAGVTK